MGGMTKVKIAVSLPADLVAHARAAVSGGRAASVSAYVAEALQEKGTLDDLDRLLADMLSDTGGPLSDDERSAADAALGR